jgi:primosomal protein N' (replication factor Y) (superfamily II helicase)
MMLSTEIAIEVAVAMPVHGTFTYRVPEDLARLASAGTRVLVPFGRRRATGYVLGPAPPSDRAEIKRIVDVLDARPVFPGAMIPFLRWTADYYKYPLGQVIETALPGGLTVSESAVFCATAVGRAAMGDATASATERRVLEVLAGDGLRTRKLHALLGRDFPEAVVSSLVRRGWVSREARLRGGRAKILLERRVRARDGEHERQGLSAKKKLILDALGEVGDLAVRELNDRVPRAAAHLRGLEQAGHVEIYSSRIYRDPFGETIAPDVAPRLTAEQETVGAAVAAALGQGFHTLLLNGVTGSGKTEVYLRAAACAIQAGHSVLVLVPEIALITQTERRFRARFGDCVAVLHSGLSEGERYDQWSRILQGEARIAIGARSAVFAPLSDIGLIIVDEEHDASYKQEGGLHYSARDLAVVRARQSGCPALLGSATPSLQSFFNVRTGKYTELRLTCRVEARPLPEIRVVDLRQCKDLRGPGRFISGELRQAMAETLDRGEQTLLFLNRRGFARFPVCAACGSALRCRNCDISLTLHQSANAYQCHYCGFSRPATAACEVCGSDKIKRLGLGTEKVEEAVAALFPPARIARMDRDTTQRKGAIVGMLKRLRAGEIDILVGTQMVAKGHDFPGITLVGILCADLSLSFPDFRAGEHTFQLLAQVAGRAGRGERPGRVILQTYNPEHFSIRTARDQDYDAFYGQEIEFRRVLGYPPVTRLIQLRISAQDPRQVKAGAEGLGRQCRALQAADPGFARAITVMGPAAASLARIAGFHRWQILLKSPDTGPLHRFVERLMAEHPESFNNRRVRVVVDVDPLFLM